MKKKSWEYLRKKRPYQKYFISQAFTIKNYTYLSNFKTIQKYKCINNTNDIKKKYFTKIQNWLHTIENNWIDGNIIKNQSSSMYIISISLVLNGDCLFDDHKFTSLVHKNTIHVFF